MSFVVAGRPLTPVSDDDVERLTREILAKVTEASWRKLDPSHPLADPALRTFIEMELGSTIERRLRFGTKSAANKF